MIIEVDKLIRTFRVVERRSGIDGALKDFFAPHYREITAVNELSFSVPQGEVLGLIGPNGAGKSTAIKMLTGVLSPSSGTVRSLGFEPHKQRKEYCRRISVVIGQKSQLWWDIPVIDSLQVIGRIYQVPRKDFTRRLDELTSLLELKDMISLRPRELSLGQRVRCDIAASFLHDPEVLFLDEPALGLDIVAREKIRVFLRERNQRDGTTIILTTHDLREIEELCSRLLIIDHGKLIFDGTVEAIKGMAGQRRKFIVDFLNDPNPDGFKDIFGDTVTFAREEGRRFIGNFNIESISAPELISRLISNFAVEDFINPAPDLEEIILKIYTGLNKVVNRKTN